MWDLLSPAVITVGELGGKGHVELIVWDVTETTARGRRLLESDEQHTHNLVSASVTQFKLYWHKLYTTPWCEISLLSLWIRTTCGLWFRCLGILHAYTEDSVWLLCLMPTGYTPPRCNMKQSSRLWIRVCLRQIANLFKKHTDSTTVFLK